jgi:hypothetical protein
MKAVSSFAMTAVISSALLVCASAVAQTVQPPAGAPAQASEVSSTTPRVPSSNRWESLPQVSADRCLAEAIGTASDPKTGAPVRASVDPQTGKPLCPTPQPATDTKPPR